MNAASITLFALSGTLMLGLILYGRLTARQIPARANQSNRQQPHL